MWTRLGPKVTLVRYFRGTEEVVGSDVRYVSGREEGTLVAPSSSWCLQYIQL